MRDGDDYVLNGSKNWVTNGQQAGVILVFARTGDKTSGNKGLSCFIVENGTKGLEHGKPEDKMGLRGSDTIAYALEDLRVPASQRLGEEGQGFKIAMSMLDRGRIGVASHGDRRHARRVQGSHHLCAAAQGVRQAHLEDPDDSVQTVRDGAPHSGGDAARGARRPGSRTPARTTRAPRRWPSCTRPRAATWVTHQAIQIHGGYGYVKEYAVERYYRDARVMEIYEGTSEIQRLVIARDLQKNGALV